MDSPVVWLEQLVCPPEMDMEVSSYGVLVLVSSLNLLIFSLV